MSAELRTKAIKAVEQAAADNPGALLKIKACRLLREATGAGLRDIVPAVEWALSQHKPSENALANEKAAAVISCRTSWSQAEGIAQDLDQAGLLADGSEIKRLRAAYGDLHAAYEQAMDVIVQIDRMTHSFATPRDAGRVMAFVGDIKRLIEATR